MTQGDLLSWREAQRKGDVGMTRAVEHADRVEPAWSERALGALQAYCLSHSEFTAEEAREALHAGGLSLPPDGRAWGAVFKRAASLGWIEKAGYAPRRCGNMTPTIVWVTR
jgi:hypothetical protein